ncbi:MAG: hypothetical protein ACRD38_11255 [Nitrososphaerales archaeon]
MKIDLNVSVIARQLVYGSKPRIPYDRLVTCKEMQDYVTRALSIAFGQYIHGLEYGRSKQKFSRTYPTRNGVNCNIIAIPDSISPSLLTEEKCTFNFYKTKDLTGEIQLQLEGYVCDARLGILKIRHIQDNTLIRHIISLDESSAINLIERYIEQTLLPYL